MNVEESMPFGPGYGDAYGIGRKSITKCRVFFSLLLIVFLAGCGGGSGSSDGDSGPAPGLDSSAFIATVNLSTSMNAYLAGDAEVVNWIRAIVDADGDAMAIWGVSYIESGLVTSGAAWASYYDHGAGTWGSEQKILEDGLVFDAPQAIFDENGDLFVFGRVSSDWWWNKFSPSIGWKGQETFPDDLDLTPLAITALREVIVSDDSIPSNLSLFNTDTNILIHDVLNAGVTGGSGNASESYPDGKVVMAIGQNNSGVIHARIRQYSPESGWESEMQTLEHSIGGNVIFSINSVTRNTDGHIAVMGTASNLSSVIVLAAYYDGSQWLPWQVLDEVPGLASVLTSSVRIDAQGRAIALWDSPGPVSVINRPLFGSSYNPGVGWSVPEQVSSGSNFFNFNIDNLLGVDDVFTMSADGNALATWSSWKNQFNPSAGSWEGESRLIEDPSPHPGAPRFFAISAANVNASGNGFVVAERRVTDIDDPFVITAEIRAIPIAIP